MTIKKRVIKKNGFILLFINILLLLLLTQFSTQAASVPIQETDLTSWGNATGIHEAVDGTLYVVDREMILHQVNPQTGSYTKFYPVGWDALMDITLAGEEGLWWTDEATYFGDLVLSSGNMKIYEIIEEDFHPYEESLQLGPVIYTDDLVWLASWFGPKFGMFSYQQTTNHLCLYSFESSNNGLFAADLIYHDGLLWMIDWFKNALISMDPTNGRLVRYLPNTDINPDANLKSDGSLLWWTENTTDGDLVRFDPATSSLKTFDLPLGERAKNLTLEGDVVWYTNHNGSYGRLDPAKAAGTPTTLTGQVIAESITPVCVEMDPPYTDTAAKETGTFSWEEITSTITKPLPGVQVFSLPTDAEPFGIATGGDYIWVSDSKWQKLVRMSLGDVPPEYEIFIPLILK